MPTQTEWNAETGITDPGNGYNQLKLPLAGYHDRLSASSGAIGEGTSGAYWSSSADPGDATRTMAFYLVPANTGLASTQRANGFSVRCVKD